MTRILLIAVLLVLNTSCNNKNPGEKKENIQVTENTVILTNEQFRNAGIQTGVLSAKTISSVLKVTGKIDVPPQNMVSVSVPLGGYLQSTKL